jgi:hypothetical protein
MKAKSNKNFTKTSFVKESLKVSHRGVNNAYDLNRIGHFCGNKVESHSKSTGQQVSKK